MTVAAWALASCVMFIGTMPAADLSRERKILNGDTEPERLEAAAIAIASSNDSSAMADLAGHLGQSSFLNRLGFVNLGRVFRVLTEHPSPATAALCVGLADSADFGQLPARLNFLLNALAAVRPTPETAADIFRKTSRSGYLEVNGPLLARNGSPRALLVLAELLADSSLPVEERVSVAHWGLVPYRTNPGVISMCAGLLKTGRVSRDVEIAIVESLYDYQPVAWYGKEGGPSGPSSWSAAPVADREQLKVLAPVVLRRRDLTPVLRAAIQDTLKQLR